MKKLINILFLIGLGFLPIFGQELPDKFFETEWEFSFDRPIGLKFDELGNTFVFTKPGQIWRVDSNGMLQNEVVLDISEEVTDWGDHGLVSIALDPDFENNRYIYLYYTLDRHYMLHYGSNAYDSTVDIYNQASMGRLTRYQLDYNDELIEANHSTRKILFGEKLGEGNPILMGSHGVGTLSFGGDGSLLFSCGEAGSYTEYDIGNAEDTYHEQAIEDGIIHDYENIGAFRSMLKSSAAGKILRIDPETGLGIPNNPFYEIDNPNSIKSKVWVLGLRNPYKLIGIPGTSEHTEDGDFPGKFYVGDVGSSLWEELNLVNTPGEWFGWPKNEGIYGHWAFKDAKLPNPETPNNQFQFGCGEEYYVFDDFIRNEKQDSNYWITYPCDEISIPAEYPLFIHRRPILTYSNDLWNPPAKTLVPVFDDDGNGVGILLDDPECNVEGDLIEGGSAMPGDICELSNFPEEYFGDLFLIDYHGWINAITIDNDEVTKIKPFAKLEKGITDLQFNEIDGKLYYVHVIDGKIRQITYGGIRPPLSVIESDKFYGSSPLTVNFSGEKSQSFDESELSFEWDFGDGEGSDLINPIHTFDIGEDIQSFEVQLIVKDTSGNISRSNKLISVNNTPPKVSIVSVEDQQTYSQSATNIFDLKANVVDSEHLDSELDYSWQINLHHSGHVHLGPIDSNHETFALIEPTGCELESFFYEVTLSVMDSEGLIGRDTVDLLPYCGDDFSEFVSLDGIYLEDGILLEWEISLEDQVAEYIVEHTNGFNFQPVGFVSANGSSSYNFVHDSPNIGDNYYRIRTRNSAGDRDYSNIINRKFTNSFGYTIGPNPVISDCFIMISRPFLEKVDFLLYDLSGKLIHEEHRSLTNHQEINLAVDLENVPTGVYAYKLLVNGDQIAGRLVKF